MIKKCISLLLTISMLLVTGLVSGSIAQAATVIQKVAPVAGGMSHTIALRSDGTIWTWGSNQQLQLGMSAATGEQPTPKQVEGISSVISVSAGYDFSLALRYDGSVSVLGGEGASRIYSVPGLTGIVAVAAGQTDALALDNNGRVWQWSIGGTPRMVSSLKSVAAISAGGAHFLALTYSGEVWAWGANWNGQLGNGSTVSRETPVRVLGLTNIICVAAGYSHSLAVGHDGAVYAWGSNTYGQLGDGTTDTSLSPIQVKKLADVVQISAGNETSMALTKKNELYTWGYGEYGQLGDDTFRISQKTPTRILAEGTPQYIASGVHHNFYVTTGGDLFVWGRNRSSQLGTGLSTNENYPKQVLTMIAKDDAYSTNYFADASAWAVPELTSLLEMDLVPPMFWDGYRDNITRAEFAGLLVSLYEKIKELEVSYPRTTNFKDIASHSFEPEIRKAYELGLVNGTSETRFNPDGAITRQEATKMICSFVAKMEGVAAPSAIRNLAYYKDASQIAEWAIPFVAFAYENDIMQGSTDGSFMPLASLTREQTLIIVLRTIQKYEWA